MSDPFQKSLEGASQFVYLTNQSNLQQSLVGSSQKIPIPNASFINQQQLERDKKIYQQLNTVQPIEEESENEFLNVGKWKNRKKTELAQQINRLKQKTNDLESSIFSRSGNSRNQSNMKAAKEDQLRVEEKIGQWKKKSAVEQADTQNNKIKDQSSRVKSNLSIQQSVPYREEQVEESQELSKKEIGAEDQEDDAGDMDQQEEEDQEEQQEEQQQEDQEEQQEEEEEEQEDEETQFDQSASQSQSQSSYQPSQSSEITIETKQQYFKPKEASCEQKNKYSSDKKQEEGPVSKWNKKSATVYHQSKSKQQNTHKLAKTKYDDSFVSDRSINHRNQIQQQIDDQDQARNEFITHKQDWGRIQKILVRIRKLII